MTVPFDVRRPFGPTWGTTTSWPASLFAPRQPAQPPVLRVVQLQAHNLPRVVEEMLRFTAKDVAVVREGDHVRLSCGDVTFDFGDWIVADDEGAGYRHPTAEEFEVYRLV